jgi:cell pole-organizing protein PopZ
MTQSAKVQDPSMEEILASIRRIIADDDAARIPSRAGVAPLRSEASGFSSQALRSAASLRSAAALAAEPAGSPRSDQVEPLSPQPAIAVEQREADQSPTESEFTHPASDEDHSGLEMPAAPATEATATDEPTATSEQTISSNEPKNSNEPMVSVEKSVVPESEFGFQSKPESGLSSDMRSLAEEMGRLQRPAPQPEARPSAPSEVRAKVMQFDDLGPLGSQSYAKADDSLVSKPAERSVRFASESPEPPSTIDEARRQFVEDRRGGPIVSPRTSAAVDTAFNSLATTVLGQNSRTLEDLVREMLRPMLKAWLDDNLPNMVERLVKAEIERVSRGQS